MLLSFRLDTAGVRQVLKSTEVRQMVNAAALDIQVRVRAKLPPGTRVTIDEYTTDRDAAAVVIEDYQTAGLQARDGVLACSYPCCGPASGRSSRSIRWPPPATGSSRSPAHSPRSTARSPPSPRRLARETATRAPRPRSTTACPSGL